MANTSTNTSIVAAFNDYSKAEQATRELVSSGIKRDCVHLQTNTRTATAGSVSERAGESEGGIRGFFHRLFGGDDETTSDSGRYSRAVESGRSVVVVETPEQQIDRVVAVLNEYGAVDIDEDTSGAAASGTRQQWNERQAGQSIPVVNEEIKIGKRAVRRGGVRIYSTVVERPVEERVTLRDEHVRVERRAVDRPVSESDLSNLRDQSFEMTETVEEPVIEKTARVKEEVVIGKETTEKQETVRDSVRQTDVKVERFGNEGAGSDYESDFRADWQRNYAGQGGDYSAYGPSYEFGYRYRSDPRFQGRSWSDAEPELRRQYEKDFPGSIWDKTKNAVRYGWEKITGR